MPAIPNPPIDQPLMNPTTGKLTPDWVRWITQLTTIVRGL